jgi:hypothetical protein
VDSFGRTIRNRPREDPHTTQQNDQEGRISRFQDDRRPSYRENHRRDSRDDSRPGYSGRSNHSGSVKYREGNLLGRGT